MIDATVPLVLTVVVWANRATIVQFWIESQRERMGR